MSSRAERGICFSLLAFGICRIPHLADRMRLRHQSLEVVDETLAAVFGVLVVAADVDRLFRADFLTVSTENASKLINFEHQRISVAVLVFTRDQLDAVGRA